jgi:Trypsin
VLILAGASDVSGFTFGLEVPSGAQATRVSSIRTHPYYALSPEIKDDVAVLTLEQPLALSPAAHAEAIPLVAPGATPAPGATLSISGYGRESGEEKAQPNGRLYATALTALGSDACRDFVKANSAVLLCGVSASSSTCQGDSGGPLIEGGPAVQVGIVDFGLPGCPVGQPDVFSNVAAPEIRAFIEGSEAPPVAARPIFPPVIKAVGLAPVALGPLTCEPGAWSGSPSFTYTFQTETAAAQVLQSGPGNVYVPAVGLVGIPLVCIVQAANPGGVATSRSAATPAIALDTARPVASITALRCHRRSCTLSIRASDPNGVALSVRASASYSVAARCRANKRRARRRARRTVCHRTKTVKMSARQLASGIYRASASRLPYGEKVKFTAVVRDAAGLSPARPPVRSTKLRRPKRKSRTRSKRSRR